jgi:hypothetical protein
MGRGNKLDEFREELDKLETLSGLSFISNYREGQTLPDESEPDEKASIFQWPLPNYTVITTKGRRIVGRDPNISFPTLKDLIISDSNYIPDSLREKLKEGVFEQIAQEEFLSHRELGETHLAQCIKENLNQTMADLIAVYSDDRRLPFVVGAIYIEAYVKYYKLFYYSYYSSEGYLKTEWRPRKVYIQPKNKIPPKKHDFKKYYRVNNVPLEEIRACPVCGSPARLFRTGFRGKESQICCTDPSERCQWFLGAGKYDTEVEAIKGWNDIGGRNMSSRENSLADASNCLSEGKEINRGTKEK